MFISSFFAKWENLCNIKFITFKTHNPDELIMMQKEVESVNKTVIVTDLDVNVFDCGASYIVCVENLRILNETIYNNFVSKLKDSCGGVDNKNNDGEYYIKVIVTDVKIGLTNA